MKKIVIILANFIVCIFLTACGDKAEQEGPWIGMAPGSDLNAVTERTEYYDLVVETEELFDLGLWEKNPEGEYRLSDVKRGLTVYTLLGTQFAMGEPVQLWSEVSPSGVNIYLYRTDGSRELLLQGFSGYDSYFVDARFHGYMDQDKNCYFYYTDSSYINGEWREVGTVMKVLSTGEVQYKNTLESGVGIYDIGQMEDGRVYLLLGDQDNFKKFLKELDPDTGRVIEGFQVELPLADINIGTAKGLPALAGFMESSYGIESIDMAAQSASPLLYFDGTCYGWHIESLFQDFRMLEDGTIEFLWTDKNGRNCIRESLRMKKVEKTPIVVRGIFSADFWLSEQVNLFNQGDSSYHVILENCGYGNDLEDFARLTSVQVGAGKGPDILCGDYLLHDYINGMLDKGVLEELNPYMEASGIREEDYFPLVFAAWRQGEKIYSITPKMMVSYEKMDAEILGSGETPDIETLADALLAREGSAVYRQGFTSGQVLNALLQGSEELWGMVDWDAGSCDFNTPLFGKLLEAARRYGYDDRRLLEPEITYSSDLYYFFNFYDPLEYEANERVFVGTLFDDGCHALSDSLYTMAVNANSVNKEGAWEFIVFLLGEGVQCREDLNTVPVHRDSFQKWLEREIRLYTEVQYKNGKPYISPYVGVNIPEEKKEAYRKAIEDARPLPIQTAPVLKIIQEEAEDYFNGSKSVEEVSGIINNRVKLYLNERK